MARALVRRHARWKLAGGADGDEAGRHARVRLHRLEPPGRARHQLLLLGDLGRDVRADLPAARLGRDLERGRDQADRPRRARGNGRELRAPGADLDRHRGHDPDRQQPLDDRAREDVRREPALRRPGDRGVARQPRPPRDARPRRGGTVLRRSAHGHVLRRRRSAGPPGRSRPGRGDPERRLPVGERREPGARDAAALPVSPRRARFRRARQASRRRLSRVRLHAERRPRPDGPRPVRQGHARPDEPRPLRRLSRLQRGLLHVPLGERGRAARRVRRACGARPGRTSSGATSS